MKQFEYMQDSSIREKYKSEPEYIAASKKGDYYVDELFPFEKFLNKLGQEGWEVSCTGTSGGLYYLAKREIPQERTRSYTPSSSISR